LKKTWKTVLIVVFLLIIQAMAELELPDYTSRIVNIGIQQGGIENCVPEVVRKSSMDDMLLAIEDDNYVLDRYKLISKNNLSDNEYKKYLEKYPELENQDLYVLNEVSDEETEKLENIMAKPLIMFYFIETSGYENAMKQFVLSNMPPYMSSSFQDKGLIEIVRAMPDEQSSSLIKMFSEEIDKKVGSMLGQSAITATKYEYEAVGIDMDKMQTNYIWISGLKMLGVALIIMITGVTIMFFSSGMACKLAKHLREEVFEKVLKYSNKEFREFSTASLITRSTNDIQQIQGMIQMLFRTVIFAPIMGIGGLIRVITKSNTSMVWIIGFAILCILTIVLVLFIVAMPKFKKLQTLIDKINLVAREILTGLPVIRAFHKEREEEKRFDLANIDLMKSNIFVNRVMSFMMPLMMLLMNSISLLIIWVAGHNIDSGIMQVGDMMAIIQYTMQIVMAFLMISMISIMLPRAAVSATRINEVLEKDLSIKDKKELQKLDSNKKGLVEFKNVSFRYPDADMEILTDINFTAEPGKTTAIIGSTGSGKSTIINLIPRFYDVTGGELCIDGVNVKDVSQKDLRDVIGYVPQKGILFSGTIESNIKYADENMSDEKMYEAARIAQATEFVESKPEGFSTPISQGRN
jgi:ATP-binding cassette subfamily B protein